MKLGIVALSVNIVADYIASSSKSTFPIGAVVGGLIGGLALILAMVALYLFKPNMFNPYIKRKMIVHSLSLPYDDRPKQL
jgi:hypothetical protein